jgi:hypothetical protein
MTPRSLVVLSTALSLLLAACSGNMGSGATPPVSAPVAGGMGGVNGPGAPQSMASSSSSFAPLAPASPSVEERPLEASLTAQVNERRVLRLPEAADYGGTLCIGPATASGLSCSAATPTPSAEPSANPSATPTAASTPGTVLITPPPPGGLRMKLMAYPGSAPSRDGGADDGATNPLMELDFNASADLSIGGLHAFTLTLPREQASSKDHYALVLYDHDQRTNHGTLLPHKQPLHSVAVALSAQLSGKTLTFVDHPSPLKLTAKHHYTVVLYTDAVPPTPVPPSPSSSFPPPSLPSFSPVTTPAAFSTPFVTYPNASPSS